MGKRKGKRRRLADDGDGEIQFPEEAIQLIQSFLPGKQAARTSIVSKSWYHAWLTRPQIDLDQNEFWRKPGENAIWDVLNKTVQRYEDSNLKVETLKLNLCRWSIDSPTLSSAIKKLVKMGVKDLSFSGYTDRFLVPYEILEADTLLTLSLPYGWSIEKPPVKTVHFSKLKFLTLNNLRINGKIQLGSDSDHLSLMFPCLEGLTLSHCEVIEPVQISSTSLKFITLEFVRDLSAEFDVPNIRKFKFIHQCFPSKLPNLSITTDSTDWESDVCLHYDRCTHLGNSWPPILKRFLNKLSGSKVYLSLVFDRPFDCHYTMESKGKQGFVLENLRLRMVSPSYYDRHSHVTPNYERFFDVLFECFPPKFITPNSVNYGLVKFMHDELIRDGKGQRTKIQTLFARHGLTRVSLECFDASSAAWQPFSTKTWLSLERIQQCELKVRYRLEWHGENAPTTQLKSSVPNNDIADSKSQPSPAQTSSEPSTHGTDSTSEASPEDEPVSPPEVSSNPPTHTMDSTPVNSVPSTTGGDESHALIQTIRQEVSQRFDRVEKEVSHRFDRVEKTLNHMQMVYGRIAERLGIEIPPVPLDNPNEDKSGGGS